MKPVRTLLFILSVILLLGIGWYFFPAEGLTIGKWTLNFPSYADDSTPNKEEVNVDKVLDQVAQSFEMTCSDNLLDSMRYFRNYLKENPNRIYLPNDDYTFFDTLFAQLEQSEQTGKTFRIMHYGDSQIEMDRISSVLRERLQEVFGGSGPNMVPAIQTVPTISVSQWASNLNRFMVYGDVSRASHNRYGVMSQFCQVNGSGSISFSQTHHYHALPRVKDISSVSVLLGRNSQGFRAVLTCDTIVTEPQVLDATDSVSLITWHLPADVKRGTISFNGNAEIYAVLLDGKPGIAVDNVALRGCSGTIFTQINETNLHQSFELLNTRLIILQFGVNRIPSIHNTANVVAYIKELETQIDYIQRVAPNAKVMFVGPADMAKRYNGKLSTWKTLPELNDSLLAMSMRKGIAYWDLFHVMGGEGSIVQWMNHKPAFAGPDLIHFTFTGAQEIGAYLARSFITYYDFYKLRQHVPSDKVIEFVNLDWEEDSIRTAGRLRLPVYDPYKSLKR